MTKASSLNVDELVEKAKAGTISQQEIDEAARKLANEEGNDLHGLMYVIGRTFSMQYESMIAKYLYTPGNDELSMLALEILCDQWALADKYFFYLHQFLKGVTWDTDGWVRLISTTSAGNYIRNHKSPRLTCRARELLKILVKIFTEEFVEPSLKKAAYFALARGYGLTWQEAGTFDPNFDLRKDPRPEVLEWAQLSLGD